MTGTGHDQPLRALGLSAIAEKVYFAVTELGEQPVCELASVVRVTESAADGAVAELREIGLVTRVGDLVTALPPDVLESYADRLNTQARTARDSAAQLAELWRGKQESPDYIEVATTFESSGAAQLRVLAEATSTVRALSIGPVGPTARPLQVAPGATEAMARGVLMQVVYSAEIVRDGHALEVVRELIDAGQEARVYPGVPLNLVIADDALAMIVFQGPGHPVRHALVISPSGLLTSLINLFETFWRMAVPVHSGHDAADLGTGPADETRQLLTYLSAGLTDESIARELGVSERTVARRIARLQQLLGAVTRFQLGVQAARRGWL